MITFKNRYAEFDNLDDSYNENVLRNCYHREYRKNFLNRPLRQNENFRYHLIRSSNFNDIRNNNYFNNNNQSQKSFTPFPRLPPINNNNNFNTISNESYQLQNINPSRSSPNMPSLYNNNNNYISTPYNNNNNNYNNNYNNNNDNSFNRYDPNNSSDSIQFFNETGYINNNDYNQDQNIINSINHYSIKKSLDNELDQLEKERKLLLEQEKLNQLDFELRLLRQKRNADLQRRLDEQQNLIYINNRLKQNEIMNNYIDYNDNNKQIDNNVTRVIYNYRNTNRGNDYKSYANKALEEKLKSSLMDDKLHMNELIKEINKMKMSQNEANIQFQKKMDDLVRQNESIKRVNEKMIEKIRDMKYALSENKPNNNDYLIEQRKNIFKQRKLFDNDYENNNNSKSYNNIYSNVFDNNLNKKRDVNFEEKNIDYYLGKKDKDIEEFNSLNKNLVSNGNNVVVTPLLFKDNQNKYEKKYYSPYEKYFNNNKNDNDYSGTRKENLYSLIRKNNNRLEKIKELEEKI